jgi:hypothetical protein
MHRTPERIPSQSNRLQPYQKNLQNHATKNRFNLIKASISQPIQRMIDEMLQCATFCYMSTVIRISDHLAKEAKTRSKVEHRSMTSQLEYWATIGKAAEENPDLPFSFIKETLMAMEEMKEAPLEEYTFG